MEPSKTTAFPAKATKNHLTLYLVRFFFRNEAINEINYIYKEKIRIHARVRRGTVY